MGIRGKILALIAVSSLVIGPVASAKPAPKGGNAGSADTESLDLDSKPKFAPKPPSSLKPAPAAPRETPSAEEDVAEPPEIAEPAPLPADKLEKLKAAVRANPKDRVKLQQLAEAYYKKADYTSVTKLLWPHVEKLDATGLQLLARAHEKKGEGSEMLRAVNLLLAKDDKDYEALVLQGNAIQLRPGAGDKGSKITEAKEAYKKALEVNPKYQPAYDALAKLYQKNPYELRILYQDMVSTFGPRIQFLTKLCEISTNDGDNEEGERYCRQGIEKDKNVPDNHVYLAIIAKQKGEPDRAKELYKKAAEQFPKSEFAQYEYGNYLLTNKSDIEAYKVFEKCIRADSRSERCLMGLGLAGVQIQKYDPAYNAMKLACHIGGRKHSATVRKAIAVLRQQKALAWSARFEDLASGCSL